MPQVMQRPPRPPLDMTPPARVELQAFRQAMGWSQVRLAERLGVTAGAVEGWEHTDPAKRKTPPPHLIAALRDFAEDVDLQLVPARYGDGWVVQAMQYDGSSVTIGGSAIGGLFPTEVAARAWARARWAPDTSYYTWKHFRRERAERPTPGVLVQQWSIPARDDQSAIEMAQTRSGDLVRGRDFAVLVRGRSRIIYAWND